MAQKFATDELSSKIYTCLANGNVRDAAIHIKELLRLDEKAGKDCKGVFNAYCSINQIDPAQYFNEKEKNARDFRSERPLKDERFAPDYSGAEYSKDELESKINECLCNGDATSVRNAAIYIKELLKMD